MPIPFEDRSVETPDQEAARRIAEAGLVLIRASVKMSDGVPQIGLSALALALGQSAAAAGVSVDELLAAVRHYYDAGPPVTPPTAPPAKGQS